MNCIFKATSKNVIPAKAGIQKVLTLLDSRLRGSDKLVIIRGSLKDNRGVSVECYKLRLQVIWQGVVILPGVFKNLTASRI